MKRLIVLVLLLGIVLIVAGCKRQAESTSTPAVLPANTASAANTEANTEAVVAEGTYVIGGVTRPHCVDLGAENANKTDDNLHRYTCGETAWQKWNIRVDPTRPGRYLISWAGAPDKYWGVENRSNDPNSYVLWEPRNDHSFQSWIFIPKGGVGISSRMMVPDIA